MAQGLTNQRESRRSIVFGWSDARPWRVTHHSGQPLKTWKHRAERRRAKRDPECMPQYRRYCGYEY